MKKTILIVDDTKANIRQLLELLGEYDLLVALDGEKALEIVKTQHVDLILLDIVMPGMDGFEVCKRLQADRATASIPVIFSTSKTDDESINRAYEVGGVDYITKPYKTLELHSRVKIHLFFAEQKYFLKSLVKEKIKELEEVNEELIDTQREMVYTMGVIGEKRSQDTANHVKRVALYSELLARVYGLSEEDVKLLKEASPMHDIGKVGIADNILNKPGKLTKEEFEAMKKHTTLGYDLLKNSKGKLLQAAATVAHQHQEKFDGSGYPQG